MSTIYIHYPFCLSKCYYCDFNSIACKRTNSILYLPLYANVLNLFNREFYKGEKITSIYFGGGTPSLLSVEFIEEILTHIHNTFNITSDAEITLEVNPKTIDKNKAKRYKEAGINRLSIGIQSFIDADLKILGRIHNSYDALTCVYEMCHTFNNVSIDLIYNRPGQKVEDWVQELKKALQLPIQHVSLYELIIEDNTYMKHLIDKGFLPKPSVSDKFLRKTFEIAEANNFEMYEASNFAKTCTGYKPLYSRHNLSYWNYEDYYGVGAGAHSRVHSKNGRKCAISQCCNIVKWCNWAKNPVFKIEELFDEEVYTEKLLMGLRTKLGININDYDKEILKTHNFYFKIKQLIDNEYAYLNKGRMILTVEGMLRLNIIVSYLTS